MSTPSSPTFVAPLTSFFRDIGLYRPPLPREMNGGPIGGSIGDIWQAEKAAFAFEKGQLRSLSLGGGGDDDDNTEGDLSDKEGSESIDNCDDDGVDNDEEEYIGNNLQVVFRNDSPAPLILCWVSDTGQPYHFYRLEPSSKAKSNQRTRKNGSFRKLDTDHLEHTSPGHAFCVGYVRSEEEIEQVHKSKSLFLQAIKDSGNNAAAAGTSSNGKRSRTNGTDDVDGDEATKASSIVVGGYRAFSKISSSSSSLASSSTSSSLSLLSRRIQLVTISHSSTDGNRLRRGDWLGKKTSCFSLMPWCLGARKRSISDDESDCDDNHDNNIQPLDPRGWRVSARWVHTKSRPHDTTSKVYETVTVGGWPCRMEPNWSGGDEASAEKLQRDIHAASKLLPPHARDYLRNHCKIWVNRSLSWGSSDCPVRGRGCCYHPSKKWLVQNGLSPDKHMCVEVNQAPLYRRDCDLWGIGGVMLHELSHAYHHCMLPDGYENQEIQKCYELAMEEGLYDSIDYHSSGSCNGDGEKIKKSTAKAYACTNAMEYFAELSAAFLGGLDDTKEYNKWYPYNRKQIQKHDPRAYSMLSRMWKVDVTAAGKTTTK